jgi:hypothetical protein
MRNMIASNIKAFENLINQLFDSANIISEFGKRFISTNPEEKRWLSETEVIECLNVLPNVRALRVEFDNFIFLILIGVTNQKYEYDSTVIEENDSNAGLITLLISENYLRINPTINFLEFDDNIMSQHKDIDYKGHNYIDLLNFLEPFQIFKIPDSSLLINENLHRILIYVYSNNPNNLILKFNKSVLELVSDISLVSSKNISYGLLLYSLLSTNYKHSFLELYRLVERLFPINYLKDLHQKIITELTFLEFTSELENVTSWRPREDEAIEKIFSISRLNTKEAFRVFLDSSVYLQTQTDYKYFYKLRNSIVHFRANHEEYDLTDSQWNLLIFATLSLIDEQYSLYNKILEE